MGDLGPGDLPGLSRPGRSGVVNGEPVATALFLFMVFTMLVWMTQPGGPLVGCAQCQAGVGQFFSPSNHSTTWMLYLVVPLTLAMFVTYFVDQIAEADEGQVGDLARQLQALAPQTGLRGLYGGVTFQGTRRQFREAARQETARQRAQVEHRLGTIDMEIARRNLQTQLNTPGLSSGQQLQIQAQIERLDREIARRQSRVQQLPGPFGVSPEAGLPTVAETALLPAVEEREAQRSAQLAVASRRERERLELIAEGASPQEAARIVAARDVARLSRLKKAGAALSTGTAAVPTGGIRAPRVRLKAEGRGRRIDIRTIRLDDREARLLRRAGMTDQEIAESRALQNSLAPRKRSRHEHGRSTKI